MNPPTVTLPARATVLSHVGLLLALLAARVLLALGGLALGSTGLTRWWGALQDPMAQQLVWDIRLPRSLGAGLAGALLGLAGALAQGLFRNPLADPYLLGSASGASLGVVLLAWLLGWAPLSGGWASQLGLSGAAFAGASGAVLLTLALAQGVQNTLRLLLAGVVVGVVLGAMSSLVVSLVPQVLPTMQAFMLGSTGYLGWSACGLMAAVVALCLVLGWTLAPVLDGLALGDATAHSLGLPLRQSRLALILILALATGTAVAQTGLVAFVGLAAPHLVRVLLPCRHRWLLLLSCLSGAVLLLVADLLARTVLAPRELPVGLLTAILGGSYLLWLMRRLQVRGGA